MFSILTVIIEVEWWRSGFTLTLCSATC